MKLVDIIVYVEKFYDVFNIVNNYIFICELSEVEIELCFNFMKEENEEYFEVVCNGDIVEVVDVLGDQLYIFCGTILKYGLQYKIVEVFEEIQCLNMSKLDVVGNLIYWEDGKVMKLEFYFKLDIVVIFEK